MTTSMAPVRPVVPMLRAPGRTGTGNTDHQVRVDGRPCCGAIVNPNTWTVIPADRSRNRCVKCDRETS